MDGGCDAASDRYRHYCLLSVCFRRAVIRMNGLSAAHKAALYVTAFVNLTLAALKLYAVFALAMYAAVFDAAVNIAVFAVCILCAGSDSLSKKRRRVDLHSQIEQIIFRFPQVSRINGIDCKRAAGRLCISLSLSFNTYSVHGSGARTCQSIENALKRHLGNDIRVSISVKRYSLIPQHRRRG